MRDKPSCRILAKTGVKEYFELFALLVKCWHAKATGPNMQTMSGEQRMQVPLPTQSRAAKA